MAARPALAVVVLRHPGNRASTTAPAPKPELRQASAASRLYDPRKPERVEVRGFRGDGLFKTALSAVLLFGVVVFVLGETVF
ncbi:hypothetical protein [Streptomyces griseorubiginosus]|uniref:hypothetical protein n=1 Tax=Streptomyces griseorubiginosus TaxID=67304 RepID=UPI0036E89C22